jgi:hypothetical protein
MHFLTKSYYNNNINNNNNKNNNNINNSNVRSWSQLVSWSSSQTNSVIYKQNSASSSSSSFVENTNINNNNNNLNILNELSSTNILQLDSELQIDGNNNNKKEMLKNPCILVGVAFNVGDEFSYYLSLPTIFPSTSFKSDGQTSTSTSSGAANDNKNNNTNNNDSSNNDVKNIIKQDVTKKKASFDDLNMISKELICRYVGFEKKFNRCVGLIEKFRKKNFCENNTIYYNKNNNENENEKEINPLFFVSKSFNIAVRNAMAVEWKKGFLFSIVLFMFYH